MLLVSDFVDAALVLPLLSGVEALREEVNIRGGVLWNHNIIWEFSVGSKESSELFVGEVSEWVLLGLVGLPGAGVLSDGDAHVLVDGVEGGGSHGDGAYNH